MLKMMIGHHRGLSSKFAKPLQRDGQPPIEELSSTKRKALIACWQGGGILYKRSGTWTSSHTGVHADRISGVTVADRSRDGLLTITTFHKHASAHLTPRGIWFAEELLNPLASDLGGFTDARTEEVLLAPQQRTVTPPRRRQA
jgi:hypothetical protein